MCVERMGSFPFSSDHLWPGGLRNEPVGQCMRCGEHIYSYNERSTKRAQELMAQGILP